MRSQTITDGGLRYQCAKFLSVSWARKLIILKEVQKVRITYWLCQMKIKMWSYFFKTDSICPVSNHHQEHSPTHTKFHFISTDVGVTCLLASQAVWLYKNDELKPSSVIGEKDSWVPPAH